MALTKQEVDEIIADTFPIAPIVSTIDITGVTTLDLDQYADVTIANTGGTNGYIPWLTYTGLTGTFNPGDTIAGSGGGTGIVYVFGPTDTIAYLINEGSPVIADGETITSSSGGNATVNKGYGTFSPYDDVWIPTRSAGVFQVGEQVNESVSTGFFMLLTDDGTTQTFTQGNVSVSGGHTITGVTSGATGVSPSVGGGSWWGYFNQYAPAEVVIGQTSGAQGIVVGDPITGVFHISNITGGPFQFPEPLVGQTSGLLVKAWSASTQYSIHDANIINLTDIADYPGWTPRNQQETLLSITNFNNGVFSVTLRPTTDTMQVTIQHTAVATAVAGDIVLENDTDVVLIGRANTTRSDFIVLNNAEQNDVIGQEGGAVY